MSRLTVHGTAVAIGTGGLLIRGLSQAGKSRLALRLIEASTRRRPVRLIGDDRVLLSESRGRVTIHGHPRIAGFIERRGLGIVAMPFLAHAVLRAIVDLVDDPAEAAPAAAPTSPIGGRPLPTLALDRNLACVEQRARVLTWWDSVAARHNDHRGC